MTANAIAGFIDNLEKHGGLKGTDIANMASVSKATVSRWLSGKAQPVARNELLLSTLAYIVNRLEAYYEPSEVRMWLHAPHPQLSGERAIDVIRSGRAEDVLQVIQRLDDGIYL